MGQERESRFGLGEEAGGDVFGEQLDERATPSVQR